MELWPSQVRKIVLDGHGILRKQLAKMESLISDLTKEQGGKTAPSEIQITEFRDVFTGFCHSFLEHIQLENKILKPALADADAWGQVRVEKMEEEHVQQKEQIEELMAEMEKLQESGLLKFANSLRPFIKEIYEDMKSEEEDCLSDEVLRDDVITISGCSE